MNELLWIFQRCFDAAAAPGVPIVCLHPHSCTNHLSRTFFPLYFACTNRCRHTGIFFKSVRIASPAISISLLRYKGIAELTAEKVVKEEGLSQKIRKAGGGRKHHRESQAGLIEA